MSSMTSPRAFLRTPGLHWPSRILRLRRMGRPASWRVESWRVKVQSCLFEMRPIVNDRFFLRPLGRLAAALPPFCFLACRSAIFVTKKPFCRMSCWASSCVAASMVSLTSLPVWSIASYWKVGMAGSLRSLGTGYWVLGPADRGLREVGGGRSLRELLSFKYQVPSTQYPVLDVVQHCLAHDILDG